MYLSTEWGLKSLVVLHEVIYVGIPPSDIVDLRSLLSSWASAGVTILDIEPPEKFRSRDQRSR